MLKKEDAMLIIIDMQERLVPAMSSPNELVETMVKFISGTRELGVPALITTQYVKGLGDTVAEIKSAMGDEYRPIDKRTFSVFGEEAFAKKFKETSKKQVIVCGIEAHICLQQSVLSLLEMGYEVFVPVDCIMSRRELDRDVAIDRMRAAGAIMSTYESILYEILEDSRAPEFRAITGIVK